jgi:site-specific DNA-methyltransferase (adenine-specific)
MSLETGKIYNMDCLDGMKLIDDASIDLIICDLPYGTTKCQWDVIIPFDLLWEQYNRIIKDNGAIVLFGQEPFSSLLRCSNLKNYRYDIYWQKERLTNIMQVKRRVGKDVETISVFYKRQCTYNPQMVKYYGKPRSNKVKNGKLGGLVDNNSNKVIEYKDSGMRYPTQVWKFKRDILTDNIHPTQKPVLLYEALIKTFSNENELVLDNCAGSGTVGVASLNTNRRFIGFEIDSDYCTAANERIAKHMLLQKSPTN